MNSSQTTTTTTTQQNDQNIAAKSVQTDQIPLLVEQLSNVSKNLEELIALIKPLILKVFSFSNLIIRFAFSFSVITMSGSSNNNLSNTKME